ncbi:MAG: ESX-1 secretion-associated protein [Pseudonocardia sp.]|mgnify:CR=1 FL=1
MSGFEITPDALTAHAARVAELAAVLRGTSDAARPLGPDAYGLVGRVFAGDAIDAAARADAAVARIANALDAVPDALRRTAEDYRRMEQAAAAGFGGPR